MVSLEKFFREVTGRQIYRNCLYWKCPKLRLRLRGLRKDLFVAYTALVLTSLCLASLQLIYFPSRHNPLQREAETIKRVKRCGHRNKCVDLNVTNVGDYEGLEQHTSTSSQAFVRNIYYIKVHKTGSTTMQNILQRFAFSHNLKVALFNRPWTMPFPETAEIDFLFEEIQPGAKFEKYNIMCDHAVFSEAASRPYMASNLTYIATLREPFSQLESSFEYFRLARAFKLENFSDPINQFLMDGATKFEHRRSFKWVQNIQAHNMGYTNIRDNNYTSVQRYLSYLDKTVDFVILLEQFDACLIYLKNMFNWSLKDILYLVQLPSILKDKVKRDQATVDKLQRLHKDVSAADYIIYEHFSKKTNSFLQNQPQEFWKEVHFFETVLKEVKRFCSNICDQFSSNRKFYRMSKATQIKYVKAVMEKFLVVHETKWNKAFKVTYGDCALMSFFTFDYNKALRVHQFNSSCNRHASKNEVLSPSVPHIQRAIWYKSRLQRDTWCNKSQHVVQTFPYKVFKEEILDKCIL